MTVVRFPQERCRWPEMGDHLRAPAVVVILPVVRIERMDDVASAETDRVVAAFLDKLRPSD
jgi:hypothetical protein